MRRWGDFVHFRITGHEGFLNSRITGVTAAGRLNTCCSDPRFGSGTLGAITPRCDLICGRDGGLLTGRRDIVVFRVS